MTPPKNWDVSPYVETKTRMVKLERFRIGLNQAISEHLVDARVEIDYDNIFREYVVRVRGHVWAEKVGPIKYPGDWWQAFRERWFPKWWLKKHPVKYAEVNIRCVYPNFRPSIEKEPYIYHYTKW